ncbi:hypothetical protein Dsin_000040 [Dipteronia sinensis]|uniref:MBD domain-containing protein n=1 Tax=Dipteronia sinensis TaxID=43782 RepID=A0AAE0DFW8_9ROSI|nr:hypothetical protein Dsin_000040 [Dipteronia sinensis]
MMNKDQAASCSPIDANLSAATKTPAAASTKLPTLPSWLPPGWQMDSKVRTSGASAGAVDKYYIDTVSGYRFRSKKEVLNFIEFGTKHTKKKDKYDASTESPGNTKSNTSDGEGGILTKNFNFSDAPKSIEWVLSSNNYDNSEDTLTPYIGCDKVPDYVSQDWTKAEAARNNRHPTNN